MVALILLWKALRQVERLLPGAWGRRLLNQPSRQLRFLRVLVQGVMIVFPRALWYSTHIREMLRLYHRRSVKGERLARIHLAGSNLVPEKISFPPARVRVAGWPGSLLVWEASERAGVTLFDKMARLAKDGRFEEFEEWLERLLEVRQLGWSRGLFSLDAHLKNYGAVGERIVLLDNGGLTNQWPEVERLLQSAESIAQPHVQLGFGPLLAGHPEVAARFDQRWKSTVNRDVVRSLWPQAQQ
jgi:hypothetical protein